VKLTHSLALAVLGSALFTAMDITPAQALVLTFDNLGVNGYDPIPSNYGSYAAGPSDTYAQGNGYTPNIGVSYSTSNATGVTHNYLGYWSTGFSSLENVAYVFDNGSLAEIRFTANPGYEVILNSFDLGSYYDATNPSPDPNGVINSTLKVLDGSGTVLYNHNGGNDHLVPYVGGLQFADLDLSGSVIRLQLGNNWDIAIDNINFDERPTSSRPAPAPPFILGYLGMGIAAGCKRIFRGKKASVV
jgi:hypothetical protein